MRRSAQLAELRDRGFVVVPRFVPVDAPEAAIIRHVLTPICILCRPTGTFGFKR